MFELEAKSLNTENSLWSFCGRNLSDLASEANHKVPKGGWLFPTYYIDYRIFFWPCQQDLYVGQKCYYDNFFQQLTNTTPRNN